MPSWEIFDSQHGGMPELVVMSSIRKQVEQSNKQLSSLASALIPISRFLSWLSSFPYFLQWLLQCGTVSQIDLLPNLLWSWCFITGIATLTKKDKATLAPHNIKNGLQVHLTGCWHYSQGCSFPFETAFSFVHKIQSLEMLLCTIKIGGWKAAFQLFKGKCIQRLFDISYAGSPYLFIWACEWPCLCLTSLQLAAFALTLWFARWFV